MATPGGTVSSSGTNYIDGLLWGVKWNTDANNPVSYYLRNDFLTWNSTETTAFQNVLQSYANVANITFSVQNDTNADLWAYKFSDADMTANFGSGILGIFYPPDDVGFPGTWGIGAFNAELIPWTTASLQPGGFNYSIMIHELGHAVGLAHPHDGGGTSSTYTDLGIGNLDTGLHTAMSYNDIGEWWNPYSNYSSDPDWGTYGQIVTPMAFDIAAVQHIYGANTNYNTGNDTYSLLTDRYEAIWDAGGTDTISAVGLTGNVTIDLNEGTYLSSQSGKEPPLSSPQVCKKRRVGPSRTRHVRRPER
jgi:serralysin